MKEEEKKKQVELNDEELDNVAEGVKRVIASVGYSVQNKR